MTSLPRTLNHNIITKKKKRKKNQTNQIEEHLQNEWPIIFKSVKILKINLKNKDKELILIEGDIRTHDE